MVKDIVSRRVGEFGLASVGRDLGVNRNTLQSYLLGFSRPGSVALVEQRAKALGWLPESQEGNANG